MYQHRTDLCFLTGKPDNAHKYQCRNSFCHRRVTKVLSGSAIPFLALGEEGENFNVQGHLEWGHELSATESGFVAVSLQLALNHGTVNLNSTFEIQHHMVIFGHWDTETAKQLARIFLGRKKKKVRTKQKMKAVLNSGSVFKWIFYFINLPTCSVLCKAESIMAAKRYYYSFRKCSFLDTVQD